eukprot:symbB.v1.2.014444.t1/scaffold1054.1/size141114/16
MGLWAKAVAQAAKQEKDPYEASKLAKRIYGKSRRKASTQMKATKVMKAMKAMKAMAVMKAKAMKAKGAVKKKHKETLPHEVKLDVQSTSFAHDRLERERQRWVDHTSAPLGPMPTWEYEEHATESKRPLGGTYTTVKLRPGSAKIAQTQDAAQPQPVQQRPDASLRSGIGNTTDDKLQPLGF